MGRDKSKVAWGKANSRGDFCSTTSSTTAVQDLLGRDERPHQGPPKSAANVLPRERTEGHSRAYRSSQRTVKTCRRASQESNLLIRSQTRYPLRHWPCREGVAQADSRRVSRHKARAGLGDLHSFIY